MYFQSHTHVGTEGMFSQGHPIAIILHREGGNQLIPANDEKRRKRL